MKKLYTFIVILAIVTFSSLAFAGEYLYWAHDEFSGPEFCVLVYANSQAAADCTINAWNETNPTYYSFYPDLSDTCRDSDIRMQLKASDYGCEGMPGNPEEGSIESFF